MYNAKKQQHVKTQKLNMPASRICHFFLLLCLLGSRSGLAAEISAAPNGLCDANVYPQIPRVPRQADNLTHIQADKAKLRQNDISTFEGRVVVQRKQMQFEADRADYHYLNETLDAKGNIRFITPDLMITGSSVHAEMKTERATFADAVYFTRERANGKAERIRVLDADHVELEDATYTSCDPHDPDWQLSANSVKLNFANHQGSASNVMMEFMDVPFFYFPYIRFPIGKNRLTGFLYPSLGSSKLHGTQVKLPFYWNIAPNYDATITPWYMSKRGTMLQTQLRYLHSRNAGQLDVDYLGNDNLYGEERKRLRWRHSGRPLKGWSTLVDYDFVSDETYLTDFGNNLNTTSKTYLNRKGSLAFTTENWSFNALAQGYQFLSDTKSYERLPQLRFASRLPRKDNSLNYHLQAEWVRFAHEDKNVVKGDRMDILPSISLPLRNTAAFMNTKLAWRYTGYQLKDSGNNQIQNPSRSLPIFSIDSGVFLERDTQIASTALLQTLEPRLYYVYAPYRDQSDLPIFDTQQSRFTINELFKEDYFDGADRVEDANRLTAMLTTRFINQKNGAELFMAGIGQIMYFDDRRVTLRGGGPKTERRSNILAELTTRPLPSLDFRTDVEWDPKQEQLAKSNASLAYKPSSNLGLTLAYHTQYKSLETRQIDFFWRITPRWRITGKQLYDIRNERNQETIGSIRYDSCCWGISLMTRERFINADTAAEKNIYLEVEFKGLSSFNTIF